MEFKKLVLVMLVVQVILIIGLTPANSYLIHQTDRVIDKTVFENKENKNLLDFGTELLVSLFSIKQIGSVSAEQDIVEVSQEDVNKATRNTWIQSYDTTNYAAADYALEGINWNCCLETEKGNICQDIPSDSDSCLTSPLPTKCEEVRECKTGCCIDEEQGLCSTKSPKAKCELDEGIWEDNIACLVEDCQKGCCVVGEDVNFVTEKRCEFLAAVNGRKKDFRDYETEFECIALKSIQEMGACVVGEGCSLKTELDCSQNGGDFKSGFLCSHPSINAGCKKQSSVGCYEGKDEIYWFDSCGNRENIYSSNKDKSWNGGKLLSKEESCNSDSSNSGSRDCGNCNSFLGSVCSTSSLIKTKIKDGNYVCKDLSCIDENGNDKQNGESWCVYDNFIGDGKDTVGSRHWKRICIDGEIKVEPCADYRGQVCVQSEIEDGDGEIFNSASCVTNEAMECIMKYNGKKGPTEECEENPQCLVQEVDVDTGFKFDMCVGEYPRGLELNNNQEGDTSSKEICGMANQKCIVLYEKKISGWKCVFNCDCETKKFSEEINNLCISLGDCGSYINYEGEGTDNVVIKNAPSISWNKYTKYEDVVEGKFAEPGSLERSLDALGGNAIGEVSVALDPLFPGTKGASALKLLGTVSGAVGTYVTVATQLTGAGLGAQVTGFGNFIGWGPSPGFQAFGAALTGFSIGSMVGGMVSKVFGIGGQGAQIISLSAGAAGAYIGYSIGTNLLAGGGFGCVDPVSCVIAIIIVIVIIAIVKILGIGNTKKVVVKFNCLPWEAPVGSSDCEKCNGNPLKPCSEYRCASLGQACKLENTDTENPICIEIENDGTAPKISVGEISEGYKFIKKTESAFDIVKENGDCIPEFTGLLFSLQTDEYAQCKWSYNRAEDYETLDEWFVESNTYTINHTNAFMMPSIEALQIEFNITIEDNIKEQLANPSMYIRCQDNHGNYNKKEFALNFCVKSGPDIMAAEPTAYAPPSGATLKYGISETPITVYMSEPTTCKYDVLDRDYENMENEMQCYNSVLDFDDYGWPCQTTLTGMERETNDFYIKCLDQPWLIGTENESLRNVNTESFVYILYSSRSDLSIDSIQMSNVTSGFEPVSATLSVETSGGLSNGESLCSYSFTSAESNLIEFKNTLSNTHNQLFTSMMSGNYLIYVSCEDNAGNIATGEIEFSINVDSVAPKVIRAYNLGGQLEIITNEEARCYYDLKRCNFNFENATEMTTGFSNKHDADWNLRETYYIKCEDRFGNINPTCAIKIIPDKL